MLNVTYECYEVVQDANSNTIFFDLSDPPDLRSNHSFPVGVPIGNKNKTSRWQGTQNPEWTKRVPCAWGHS